MRATATGTVDFTGIDVGDDEIIGQPGDYLTSPLFRGGAWRVIAVQLGGVEAILDLYQTQLAGSRNATDALQLARFGKALIAAETARLWVGKACLVAESPDLNPAEIDAFVDLARNAFEEAGSERHRAGAKGHRAQGVLEAESPGKEWFATCRPTCASQRSTDR